MAPQNQSFICDRTSRRDDRKKEDSHRVRSCAAHGFDVSLTGDELRFSLAEMWRQAVLAMQAEEKRLSETTPETFLRRRHSGSRRTLGLTERQETV